MRILISILLISLLSNWNNLNTETSGSEHCPEYKSRTLIKVERFLEDEQFGEYRLEAGVDGIEASQVAVMADSIQDHSTICHDINSNTEFGNRINEKIHPDYHHKAWDITYYYYSGAKGEFYFAVQRPASVEGWFNHGLSVIVVFDNQLNLVGGVSNI